MAHMTARTSNLAEDVVGVGDGVEAGAAAVGERLRLALMCRTTVTTAASRENPCLSVDVAEDVGDVGVVELTLGCHDHQQVAGADLPRNRHLLAGSCLRPRTTIRRPLQS
jgi:hypothetical protein